jgi:hypothetical protein
LAGRFAVDDEDDEEAIVYNQKMTKPVKINKRANSGAALKKR